LNSLGKAALPSMRFYNANNGVYHLGGTAHLGLTGSGLGGQGAFINVNGLIYVPCPASAVPPKTKCHPQNGGPSGIGLTFGQATFGAGASAGGYITNNLALVRPTNPDQNPGNIVGAAFDPTNGAYAVGWDSSSGSAHAVVMTLDSAGQTYNPTKQTDLGTLGGATSKALGISRNAKYVVGTADTSFSSHAVYALTNASAWTDIGINMPAEALASRALAVNVNGVIAGSYTAKRILAGKLHSIDVGFVYDTNTSTLKTFEASGASVIPLKVLDDGRVIGNLEFVGTGIQADHPFLFDGTSLKDFGTMTLASTGHAAFGCRVNRPNNLGELVGSCIPDNATPYGVNGSAFYLNAVSPTPTYVGVNATLRATSASVTAISGFVMGTASSIDDEHEITMIGAKTTKASTIVGAFVASQDAYNPGP